MRGKLSQWLVHLICQTRVWRLSISWHQFEFLFSFCFFILFCIFLFFSVEQSRSPLQSQGRLLNKKCPPFWPLTDFDSLTTINSSHAILGVNFFSKFNSTVTRNANKRWVFHHPKGGGISMGWAAFAVQRLLNPNRHYWRFIYLSGDIVLVPASYLFGLNFLLLLSVCANSILWPNCRLNFGEWVSLCLEKQTTRTAKMSSAIKFNDYELLKGHVQGYGSVAGISVMRV